MRYQSIERACEVALTLCLAAAEPVCADRLRTGGAGVALGAMANPGGAFQTRNPGATVEILPSPGGGVEITAPAAGVPDPTVGSRPLKDSEIEPVIEARLYATTLPVIVTSPETRTDGTTTTRQLAGMNAGTLPTWPPGERGRVVLRPASETRCRSCARCRTTWHRRCARHSKTRAL